MNTTRTTPTPATGTACHFWAGCQTDRPAVHSFEGTDLCSFHSPFDADPTAADAYLAGLDARNATRELTIIDTPEEPSLPAPSPETPSLPAWFTSLLDQAAPCTNADAFEDEAYQGYIAYGVSMTDGYFAPLDRDAFLRTFRQDPIGQLYQGNDARHTLAPQVRAYIALLAAPTCDGGCGKRFPDADPSVPPLCLPCAEERAAERRRHDARRKGYQGEVLYRKARG